jgi:hypothetical protein
MNEAWRDGGGEASTGGTYHQIVWEGQGRRFANSSAAPWACSMNRWCPLASGGMFVTGNVGSGLRQIRS